MGTETAGNAAAEVALSGQESTTEVASEAKEVLAQESTVATPEANEKPTESAPYVTEERLKAILAETLEQGKRAGQSQADKYVRKVEGQNKGLAARLTTLSNRLKEVDPDGAKELELADYKARENESAQAAEQQRIADKFFVPIFEELDEKGIARNDPRLDWLPHEGDDLIDQSNRIRAGIRKIEKEDAGKKVVPKAETPPAKKANSINTTIPAGAAPSDSDFLTRWGNGELPANKANLQRANKLLGI